MNNLKPKWESVLPLSEERIDMKIWRSIFFIGTTAWSTCAFAQGNHMDGGHMAGYGHMMNSWGGAIAMGLAVIIVVGVLVYLLIRSFGTNDFESKSHETPLDILKKRYARGEITKEQFDEMKKDL